MTDEITLTAQEFRDLLQWERDNSWVWWTPQTKPHIIMADHHGGLTYISCWCGHQLTVPTDKHRDAILRHRLDKGTMGRFLARDRRPVAFEDIV